MFVLSHLFRIKFVSVIYAMKNEFQDLFSNLKFQTASFRLLELNLVRNWWSRKTLLCGLKPEIVSSVRLNLDIKKMPTQITDSTFNRP